MSLAAKKQQRRRSCARSITTALQYRARAVCCCEDSFPPTAMMRRRGAKLEHNTSGNGSASGDLRFHRWRTFAVSSSAIIIVAPSRLLQVHAVTIASVGIDGSHNQHPRRVRRSRKNICFSGFEKKLRAIPLPGMGEGFLRPLPLKKTLKR